MYLGGINSLRNKHNCVCETMAPFFPRSCLTRFFMKIERIAGYRLWFLLDQADARVTKINFFSEGSIRNFADTRVPCPCSKSF